MQSDGITDCSDVLKMYSVGNFQASHSVIMSPLLEVHLERSSTPIRIVTTNFTLILNP